MEKAEWHYDIAKDTGRSFVERLRECPRERDPLVYAARATAAIAIRAWLRTYCRFEILGRENLPRKGSFVLVANHSSHLDAVALLSALPLRSLHRAYPLAARDYFGTNNARLLVAAIVANVMLFDRDATGLEGLKLCRRMLDEPGNVIVMFPEGTRSMDGGVGMFRRGVGLLLAGTPIRAVPCYLCGTFKAWRKGTLIPRPARVRLLIGKARAYEHVEQNDPGALEVCADLRRAVLALELQSQAQPAHPISKEAHT